MGRSRAGEVGADVVFFALTFCLFSFLLTRYNLYAMNIIYLVVLFAFRRRRVLGLSFELVVSVS